MAAMAMIGKPEVIVFDEPTTALRKILGNVPVTEAIGLSSLSTIDNIYRYSI